MQSSDSQPQLHIKITWKTFQKCHFWSPTPLSDCALICLGRVLDIAICF